MCTIAYKPQGVGMPSWDHLRNGFDKNDDGAGFAVVRRGLIYIEKGFFTFDHFKEAVQNCKISKDDVAVFHFRLATHGHVSIENTQPFPATSKPERLDAHVLTTEGCVFAHNGIFGSMYHPTMSDSAVFVRDLLSETADRILDNKGVAKLYDAYVQGSKTIIIRDDKSVHLSGHWNNDNGVKWSNMDYAGFNNVPYGGWNRTGNYTPNKHYNDKTPVSRTFTLHCLGCSDTLVSIRKDEVCPQCGEFMIDENELWDEPVVCLSCGTARTQYAGSYLEPYCPDCGGLLIPDSEIDDGDEDDLQVPESQIKQTETKHAVCARCGTEYPYSTNEMRCEFCNGIIIANVPLKGDYKKDNDLERICSKCGYEQGRHHLQCALCGSLCQLKENYAGGNQYEKTTAGTA